MEQGERRMTYEEKLDEALEWQKQQTEKDKRIKELEAQIEKMKCCGNCDVGDKACYVRTQEYVNICPSWKLKEIKEK